MESKFPEILDARGDQGALEIKSPRNRGLLHSDVDYIVRCLKVVVGYKNKDKVYFFRL